MFPSLAQPKINKILTKKIPKNLIPTPKSEKTKSALFYKILIFRQYFSRKKFFAEKRKKS
jgi:hypothetical protein